MVRFPMSDCSLGASRVAVLIFSAVVVASPARAIDCNKAKTPVEVAICSDPALGKEDARLASLYFEDFSPSPGPGCAIWSRGARRCKANR
jgi:uncharacterized protein